MKKLGGWESGAIPGQQEWAAILGRLGGGERGQRLCAATDRSAAA